jgi:hypothetical protein
VPCWALPNTDVEIRKKDVRPEDERRSRKLDSRGQAAAAAKNTLAADHDASQFNGAENDHPLALSNPGGRLLSGLREQAGRASRILAEPGGEPPC